MTKFRRKDNEEIAHEAREKLFGLLFLKLFGEIWFFYEKTSEIWKNVKKIDINLIKRGKKPLNLVWKPRVIYLVSHSIIFGSAYDEYLCSLVFYFHLILKTAEVLLNTFFAYAPATSQRVEICVFRYEITEFPHEISGIKYHYLPIH